METGECVAFVNAVLVYLAPGLAFMFAGSVVAYAPYSYLFTLVSTGLWMRYAYHWELDTLFTLTKIGAPMAATYIVLFICRSGRADPRRANLLLFVLGGLALLVAAVGIDILIGNSMFYNVLCCAASCFASGAPAYNLPGAWAERSMRMMPHFIVPLLTFPNAMQWGWRNTAGVGFTGMDYYLVFSAGVAAICALVQLVLHVWFWCRPPPAPTGLRRPLIVDHAAGEEDKQQPDSEVERSDDGNKTEIHFDDDDDLFFEDGYYFEEDDLLKDGDNLSDLPKPKNDDDNLSDLPKPKDDDDNLSDLRKPKDDDDNLSDLPKPKDGDNLSDLPKPKDGDNLSDLPKPKDGDNLSDLPKPKDDDDNLSDLRKPKDDDDNLSDLPKPKDGDNLSDLPKPKDGDNLSDLPKPKDGDNLSDLPKPKDGDNLSDLPKPVDDAADANNDMVDGEIAEAEDSDVSIGDRDNVDADGYGPDDSDASEHRGEPGDAEAEYVVHVGSSSSDEEVAAQPPPPGQQGPEDADTAAV